MYSRSYSRIMFLVFCFAFLYSRDIAGYESAHVPLKFSTGKKTLSYYRIGNGLTNSSTLSIENIQSNGSVDNIERILCGEADFALTQIDVLQYSLKNPDSFLRECARVGAEKKHLNVIDLVMFDFLHILVRSPLGIDGLSGFSQKTIWMDAQDSGTRRSAMRFLDFSGVTDYRRLENVPFNVEEMDKRFRAVESENRLDVVMIVSAAGRDTGIANLIRKGSCFPFNLDRENSRYLLTAIKKDYESEFINLGEIPGNIYGHSNNIAALTIPVVLIARPEVSDEVIERFQHSLQLAIAKIYETDGWVQTEQELINLNASRKNGLKKNPLIAGLLRKRADGTTYYTEPSSWEYWYSIAIIIVILLGGIWFTVKKGSAVGRLATTHFTITVLIIFVAFSSLCAMVVYSCEHGENPNFPNIFESMWSIVVYLVSGFEDREPFTLGGRIFSALAMILGPVALVTITGITASHFVMRSKTEMERRMMQNLRNHFVILNWNEKVREIIAQIHAPVLEDEAKTVIAILTNAPELSMQTLRESTRELNRNMLFEDVYFSPGDPTDERSLMNVNVLDAKTIVIVPWEDGHLSADERTIRSIIILKRLATSNNIRLHVVAELAKIENLPILQELSNEFPGTLETIALGEFRALLVSQAAMSPGLLGFYKGLLMTSSDTNEVYSVLIPKSAAGQSFREYASKVFSHNSDFPIVPIGIRRADKGNTSKRYSLIANPTAGQCDPQGNPFNILREGDELIVLSYAPPKQSALPEN